jgi:hypothetical protein
MFDWSIRHIYRKNPSSYMSICHFWDRLLVGIPFGDPRFIPVAVLLELVFIGLAVLVSKGYTRPLYICIILASLIIIGNSITTTHIHRMMMTFVKPVNTIVLIIGGYILQALLIYASVIAIMDDKRGRRTLTASSSY